MRNLTIGRQVDRLAVLDGGSLVDLGDGEVLSGVGNPLRHARVGPVARGTTL